MKKLFFLPLLLVSIVMQAAQFSTFNSRTDFRDESIYFLMTTRFFDGDHDNNVHCWDGRLNAGDPEWRGDFKGLIEKMDYIKALGFTAIWITPIVENASGLDYHGYHAIDFSKVDRRYETHNGTEVVTFQDVVDAAHARGMKIILDIVLNHTGNFGERNLAPMFNRDWTADQSSAEACMTRIPKSEGGVLPNNYESLPAGQQYAARLAAMKNSGGQNLDTHNYWHHFANFNWDDPTRWWAQIAGDCVDLNTENPAVYNYLIQCYNAFIAMGVDGFRIDTSGHIARLAFNKAFIPAFQQAGASNSNKRGAAATPFYMFGEVCARWSSHICYRDHDNLSPFYYTWAESKNYAWNNDPTSFDNIVAMEGDNCKTHTNHLSVWQQGDDDFGKFQGRTSQNALLQGNNYHTPDYSQASGFHVIDFPMHWTFGNAGSAFNMGNPAQDKYYNDATWNVVYVDSHDYGPDSDNRYAGGKDAWAENMCLMFTYRGIPCVYYGSEVEFQAGKIADKGTLEPLSNTGRAYYGGYLKGNVTATGFGDYTAEAGTNIAATLSQPLSQHLMRLNKIRQAVPALRKGQYSRDNCSGSLSFKRRYTDATTDSYALVTISGGATFSNIPNGTYTDCVTGDVKTVTNGSLTASCSGKGNMRVYVLSTSLTPAPGKVGNDTYFLYNTSRGGVTPQAWDGTQQEKTDDPTSPTEPEVTVEPCLNSADEEAVFFTKPEGWGSTINCYVWVGNKANSGWPGQKATNLGGGKYKYIVAAGLNPTQIVWNDGGNQTADLTYTARAMYTQSGAGAAVTRICGENEDPTPTPDPVDPDPVNPEDPDQPVLPLGMCLQSEEEHAVFYMNPNNWGQVNCYIWDASKREICNKWPGMPATPIDGGWKFTLPLGETPAEGWQIIWNGSGSQTEDLVYQDHAVYNYGIYAVAPVCGDEPIYPVYPTDELCLETAEQNVVFFTNPGNWSNVHCYIWDADNGNRQICGAWPGAAATKVQGGYKYILPETPAAGWQIIWNCGGDACKTGDLNFVNQGVYNTTGSTKLAQVCETSTSMHNAAAAGLTVTVEDHVMSITTTEARQVDIFATDGRLLRTFFLEPGTSTISNVPSGLYMVGGQKVVVL